MNNKISFIAELLNSNKINASQKEKIFELATSDIKRIANSDEIIFSEIAELKKRMEKLSGKDRGGKGKKDLPKSVTIHNPIETSFFLQALSSDSNPLKYLIHNKTDGFDLEKIQQEWAENLNNYSTVFSKNIKYNVIKRMKSLIGLDEDAWYFKGNPEKFKFTQKTVTDWCAKNPTKHPILHFDNEISLFKESIKIYNGSLKNYIEEIIKESFGQDFYKLQVELVNLENAEFYTDVDALISGLKNIFNSSAQRLDKSNKLKIVFEAKNRSEGRLRIIKIIHKYSNCDKNLDKHELFSGDGGGDFKDAEKRFLQVCDWSIISNNPDNNFNKLNILCSQNQNIPQREKVPQEEIEGYTHILTFFS
jgi:hypothetical protein